jgi:hypothetical protein
MRWVCIAFAIDADVFDFCISRYCPNRSDAHAEIPSVSLNAMEMRMPRFRIYFMFVIVSFVDGSKAAWKFDSNLDRSGATYREVFNSSPHECALACFEEKECNVWTWAESSQTCALKLIFEKKIPRTGYYSGVFERAEELNEGASRREVAAEILADGQNNAQEKSAQTATASKSVAAERQSAFAAFDSQSEIKADVEEAEDVAAEESGELPKADNSTNRRSTRPLPSWHRPRPPPASTSRSQVLRMTPLIPSFRW